MCRTRFYQYQASSDVLGWSGVGVPHVGYYNCRGGVKCFITNHLLYTCMTSGTTCLATTERTSLFHGRMLNHQYNPHNSTHYYCVYCAIYMYMYVQCTCDAHVHVHAEPHVHTCTMYTNVHVHTINTMYMWEPHVYTCSGTYIISSPGSPSCMHAARPLNPTSLFLQEFKGCHSHMQGEVWGEFFWQFLTFLL